MQSGHDCIHCNNNLCIHKVPIFFGLDHDNLLKIVPLIKHENYAKGDRLLTEGDPIDSVVILNQGSVKAFKYTPDGREQILYVFSEGDFFGEQFLLSSQTATYSVEALEPVKTCMLSKADFNKLLYSYPEISVKIIAELGGRIARMENAFQSMGIRNVDARIAGLLLEYSERHKHPDSDLIHLPLSREGMANYLGITRETMSRKLSQLENDGIIVSVNNKTIKIKERQALILLAGKTE